jgi:hypothetical protein
VPGFFSSGASPPALHGLTARAARGESKNRRIEDFIS